MDVREVITKLAGLRSIAAELGVSEQEAATGAAALMPAILDGFDRPAVPSGSSPLTEMLGGLGLGDRDEDSQTPPPTDVTRGNGILASIFGSKDVSRAVAQDASAKSGLTAAILKKMLPMVAMMIASQLAKKKGQGARR